MWRRVRGMLSHPAVLVGLLVVFALDLTCIVRRSGFPWFRSAIGDALAPDRPTVTISVLRDSGWVVRMSDGALGVLLPDFDEASKFQLPDDFVMMCTLSRRTWKEGVFAPLIRRSTWRSERASVIEAGEHIGMSSAESGRAYELFIDRLVEMTELGSELSAEGISNLKIGRSITHTNVLWWGVLHNALSLVVVAAIPCSVWLNTAAWRSRRRIRAGRCGKCNYDLRGIPGGVCPECGTESDRVRGRADSV